MEILIALIIVAGIYQIFKDYKPPYESGWLSRDKDK
jgi:hypothetical protein